MVLPLLRDERKKEKRREKRKCHLCESAGGTRLLLGKRALPAVDISLYIRLAETAKSRKTILIWIV